MNINMWSFLGILIGALVVFGVVDGDWIRQQIEILVANFMLE